MENVLPHEIERRSMEIISEELGERVLDPTLAPIIKRVIHTTADFSFADTLYFSPDVVALAKKALSNGACIVTDTNMVLSGINRKIVEAHGGQVRCFMAEEEIAQSAQAQGITRAAASMQKAATLKQPLIFAIGNAPTALVEVCRLIEAGTLRPALVIGAPVGFVNVIESKELLLRKDVPQIVARGRRGGSPVAATIVNALLYLLNELPQ